MKVEAIVGRASGEAKPAAERFLPLIIMMNDLHVDRFKNNHDG